MVSLRVAVGLIAFLGVAFADTYPLIFQGKVTLANGSPPPKTVSIERVCTDSQLDMPGPITNAKGEYVWRMEVDPMMAQVCTLRAHLTGYSSSLIDISGFNSYSNPKLPPLILTPASGDPTLISAPDNVVPGKAVSAWNAGLKAVNSGNMEEAAAKFQAAVMAVPKFAGGWNALGLVYGAQQKTAESRAAFEHAIAADPKLLTPYVNLARLCVRTQDWAGASKTADAYLAADPKNQYPEMFLHQAVARYWLQDLARAETNAQQAIRLDQSPKGSRAEYVLGRILLAKGDGAGAHQHIAKYLDLDPHAPDVDQIRIELQNLDKPEAVGADLEHP